MVVRSVDDLVDFLLEPNKLRTSETAHEHITNRSALAQEILNTKIKKQTSGAYSGNEKTLIR